MWRPRSCASRKKRLEDKIECLQMQNTEDTRDKSATENKSRNLLEKVDTLEKENEGLSRQRSELKDVVAQSQTKAQATRIETQFTRERVAELELEARNTRTHHERVEAATRASVDQAHTLFVYAYHDLGVEIAPFDRSGGEVGTHFHNWLQEELESLPSIATGLMSYASLVTCEGTTNALSHKGGRHFKAFDQSNEDFDQEVFQVEDAALKLGVKTGRDYSTGTGYGYL
jgi:regulator of replication initiation timing